MIKTLWFFIKISIFIAVAIWLITQPGEMNFNFLDYDVKIKTGIFLLVLLITGQFILLLLKAVRAIFSVPKALVEYRDDMRDRHGYKNLTRGLVAVAAGDAIKATQYSKIANKKLQERSGLSILLDAQAARLRGDESIAQHHFEELLEDKDTAFLGVRGLMKSAIKAHQYAVALKHARTALKLHPNQAWIIKMTYMLEAKNNHWDEVLKLAKSAEKQGVFSKEKIISDRVAIHLMRYDYDLENNKTSQALKELKTAYKLDNYFIPTIVRYANYYMLNKKPKKAVALIEKAWKKNPHPQLATLWDRLSPNNDKIEDTKKLAWYEKLVNMAPDNIEGYICAARAAINMGYWGEAKAYLMAAEKIYPTNKIFHMRALVEKNIAHNDGAMEEVLESTNRVMPEKRWTCQETGMVYDDWFAIAMPHEGFNTIKWAIPQACTINKDETIFMVPEASELLIDPAA